MNVQISVSETRLEVSQCIEGTLRAKEEGEKIIEELAKDQTRRDKAHIRTPIEPTREKSAIQ